MNITQAIRAQLNGDKARKAAPAALIAHDGDYTLELIREHFKKDARAAAAKLKSAAERSEGRDDMLVNGKTLATYRAEAEARKAERDAKKAAAEAEAAEMVRALEDARAEIARLNESRDHAKQHAAKREAA